MSLDSQNKKSLEMPFTIIDSDGGPREKPLRITIPNLHQRFVMGAVETAIGKIPQITALLKGLDHWGTIKARWNVGRMSYIIDPGLYALGQPVDRDPVLVTGNYKMSFDRLRRELNGRDVWILVLDTKGINVWCAAGKGTFGTSELVDRINSSGLEQIVSHRRLILPQLSGPGVAAHQVRKQSGFKVIYGLIRAKDLPLFMDNKLSADPKMRIKTFNIRERTVLIPVELVSVLKAAFFILPAVFFFGGLGGPEGYWNKTFNEGLFAVFAVLTAILAGAVLTPVFLPWLPGRAFSTKGFCMGLMAAIVLNLYRTLYFTSAAGRLELAAWIFLIPAMSAYLAMNFTGASTYTSLSGVKKEMRWAVPLEIGMSLVGLGLWIGSRFGA
jgi:hypothetical protein